MCNEFMLEKLMPDSVNSMLTSVTSSLVASIIYLNKDALAKVASNIFITYYIG
ncbi:20639_t:CDS:2 [Cetraspora pellucida]|uniref:20639_t:CDS:1 n=1 Tax=Cetraspora pellucida TaxID=1433469 RepID=A0A9N9DRX8_9GLOM|nr:20639_t:CDS:2 [Cetraspora pellucida]